MGGGSATAAVAPGGCGMAGAISCSGTTFMVLKDDKDFELGMNENCCEGMHSQTAGTTNDTCLLQEVTRFLVKAQFLWVEFLGCC